MNIEELHSKRIYCSSVFERKENLVYGNGQSQYRSRIQTSLCLLAVGDLGTRLLSHCPQYTLFPLKFRKVIVSSFSWILEAHAIFVGDGGGGNNES